MLHLQAAAEVLLKARLEREHWSLVFKDAALASRARFVAGDFESRTLAATLSRLRDIADVEVDDKAVNALNTLVKSRNALQHYGLTTPAAAVAARAAQVLDFLVAFTYSHLRQKKDSLATVTTKLQTIQSFIDARLKRLSGELKDAQDRTLECPECSQWALVVGYQPHCHFCDRDWLYTHLLIETLRDAAAPEGSADSRGAPAGQCPDSRCDGLRVLMAGICVAAAPQEPVVMCLRCATRFDRGCGATAAVTSTTTQASARSARPGRLGLLQKRHTLPSGKRGAAQ